MCVCGPYKGCESHSLHPRGFRFVDHIVYIFADFSPCTLPLGPALGLLLSLIFDSVCRLCTSLSSAIFVGSVLFPGSCAVGRFFLLFVSCLSSLQFRYDAISLYMYVRTSFSGSRRCVCVRCTACGWAARRCLEAGLRSEPSAGALDFALRGRSRF